MDRFGQGFAERRRGGGNRSGNSNSCGGGDLQSIVTGVWVLLVNVTEISLKLFVELVYTHILIYISLEKKTSTIVHLNYYVV